MSDPGDHAGGVQEWPITHDVQTGHPPKPWRHGPTLRSFDSIVGNASVPTAGTSGNNHEWTTAGQPQTLDGLPEAVLSEQPAAQKRVHEDPALAITTEQPAALLVSIAQHHRVRVNVLGLQDSRRQCAQRAPLPGARMAGTSTTSSHSAWNPTRYASITDASGTPSRARSMPTLVPGVGSNSDLAAIAENIARMFAAEALTITSKGTGASDAYSGTCRVAAHAARISNSSIRRWSASAF